MKAKIALLVVFILRVDIYSNTHHHSLPLAVIAHLDRSDV